MSENTNELLNRFDSDVKTYAIDPSPSVIKQRKQRSVYADQLLCLCALSVLSVWQSGWRALVIILCSLCTCVLSDMLFCRMSKKTYNPKDLSTIDAALSIALMMPASVHYGLVIGGALLALSVKHIFGGKNNYIFNPACVATAFLIICYPGDMLSYPAAGAKPEVWGDVTSPLVSGTEYYLMKLGTAPSISLENILLGNFAGPMGTTHFLVITVCFVCLLCRRSVSPLAALFGLGSYCALTALFPVMSSIGETLILELSGGYLMFGFVFLASDPQILPKTAPGKIAYGLIIGIVGGLFRHFGKVEGSFIFVLLIANALSLRIDEACAAIGRVFVRGFAYMRRDMGRYEKLKSDAENDKKQRLTDTMEIIVPATNYYMPPIDNKVTKINRKKSNIITRYAEKLRLKRKKEEIIRKKQLREADNNYLNVMRGMQKYEKAIPLKTEDKKTQVAHIIKQPMKRSMQKNNKNR